MNIILRWIIPFFSYFSLFAALHSVLDWSQWQLWLCIGIAGTLNVVGFVEGMRIARAKYCKGFT